MSSSVITPHEKRLEFLNGYLLLSPDSLFFGITQENHNISILPPKNPLDKRIFCISAGSWLFLRKGDFNFGVRQNGQYDFNATQCSMRDSEKEKVLDMKKGQSVTLIGTGDSATLKSPILKDCIVK